MIISLNILLELKKYEFKFHKSNVIPKLKTN